MASGSPRSGRHIGGCSSSATARRPKPFRRPSARTRSVTSLGKYRDPAGLPSYRSPDAPLSRTIRLAVMIMQRYLRPGHWRAGGAGFRPEAQPVEENVPTICREHHGRPGLVGCQDATVGSSSRAPSMVALSRVLTVLRYRAHLLLLVPDDARQVSATILRNAPRPFAGAHGPQVLSTPSRSGPLRMGTQ
jgi:hypothetical protein